jgi:hypothetical protein
MAHYAFLYNNIVTEVIVGIDETELIEGLTPEEWYGNSESSLVCVLRTTTTFANSTQASATHTTRLQMCSSVRNHTRRGRWTKTLTGNRRHRCQMTEPNMSGMKRTWFGSPYLILLFPESGFPAL